MGGSDKYNKLWRRIGSAICMFICIILSTDVLLIRHIFTFLLLIWGCISYMGWLNYIVRLWWVDIVMKREYFWNFFLENLVLQSTVLIYKHSIYNIIFGTIFAFIIAFVKVAIDSDKDGKIWLWRKDVLSEFFHGGLNCLGIIINIMFI